MKLQSIRDGVPVGTWSRIGRNAWRLFGSLVELYCTVYCVVLAWRAEWSKAAFFCAFAILIVVCRVERRVSSADAPQ